ncbi:MAG: nucleoside-diphosphate kinase [Candidatus Micrarchaeota archaeon]|nr:nucleoside-diphosphate kinase [Candidatus Micrarchaeota archaeon]
MATERTLIILKPDAVQRGKVGAILSRFEERGFQFAAVKMAHLSQELLKEHYAHIADKPFFPGIASFMSSCPVIVAVVEGKEAVEVVRAMCGPTNSRKAAPGTIRGDFALSMQCNVIHASDSAESAQKEIARFFKPEEIHSYKRTLEGLTYSADEKA